MQLYFASEQVEYLWGTKVSQLYEAPNMLFESISRTDQKRVLHTLQRLIRNSNDDIIYFSYNINNSVITHRKLYQTCFVFLDPQTNAHSLCCIVSSSPHKIDVKLDSSGNKKFSKCKVLPTISFIQQNSAYFVKISNSDIRLTKRQFECLQCLLDGNSIKETARKLFISPRTAQEYLDVVRQKAGCRNKLELLRDVVNAYQ